MISGSSLFIFRNSFWINIAKAPGSQTLTAGVGVSIKFYQRFAQKCHSLSALTLKLGFVKILNLSLFEMLMFD